MRLTLLVLRVRILYSLVVTMFPLKTFALFICAVLAISESRFVDTLFKCSIKDDACQGKLVNTMLVNISETGIPEIDVPSIDPFTFKDISFSILDLVKLHAVEGTAKGIKDCVVDHFKTEIEKGHSEMTLICNTISIRTKYKLTGSSPVLKNMFGGESVHGEGNGRVKIEKLKLKFDYFYDVERNKDGDAYFKCKLNKTVYKYQVLGKTSFAADSVFLGDTDATEVVVQFLNDNAKFIINTFGKAFFEKAMELVYLHYHKFFENVPAKYFIIEDLSQYIKN